MKILNFILGLDLKIKLASIAFSLGLTAFIISDPFNSDYAKINVKDLSLIVQNEADHVIVDEIADWIIKSRVDFRLIDIRTEKEYNEYNIPVSENIPITKLFDGKIARNEKIILYSEGGIHSAQAWFLLKAKDYKNVYMLKGGMDEWNDKILYPKLGANATDNEKAKFEIASAISRYFGGTPQIISGNQITLSVDAPRPAPKIQAPAGSATGSVKKKKREGC